MTHISNSDYSVSEQPGGRKVLTISAGEDEVVLVGTAPQLQTALSVMSVAIYLGTD